ncbi:hypothetical protein KAX22_02015, partial [bacterium]|nr:hypothetical protein [bacterium]
CTGSVSLEVMEEYITVIWNTGEDYTSTLNSSDEANLMAYLDGGGTLFLSSQDYLYDIGSPTTFSSNYLHVSSWTNDVGVDAVAGTPGDPITDRLSYTLSYPLYNWSDRIVPHASAAPIFDITASKSSEPLRPPKDGIPPDFGDAPPPGPGKQTYCALRFPAEGDSAYQVVFMAIPFESVPTAGDRQELMERILDWLQGDRDPPLVSVIVPNGGEVWDVGSKQDISWTATDPSGISSISLYLSLDGGETFAHTIALGEHNTPPFSWVVPPLLSDSAVVKAVAYDAHSNEGWNVSDSLFAIADLSAPTDVQDLSVAIESGAKSFSGDIRLWWSPVEDNVGVDYYVVYRGLVPILLGDSIAAPAETTYLDVGAVGDTLVNYYYVVKATDAVGHKSGDSNHVGEFDVPLTNMEPPEPPKISR